jgi:hypothetical protein
MALNESFLKVLLFNFNFLGTIFTVSDLFFDELNFPVAFFNFLLERFQVFLVLLFDLPIFKSRILASSCGWPTLVDLRPRFRLNGKLLGNWLLLTSDVDGSHELFDINLSSALCVLIE